MKLLRCPCGLINSVECYYLPIDGTYQFMCYKCGTKGSVHNSKEEASRAWNNMVVSRSDVPATPIVPDGKGLRFDEGKPRYDLIPAEFMEALAIHFQKGNIKYPDPNDRNWMKGMKWGTCFRALMSHSWKWFRGESYDTDPAMPDYQAHHMIAVAWNAIVLYTYETQKIGQDDRVKSPHRDILNKD